MSEVLLEAEPYRHTLEGDVSSEHVPGAEPSEHSVRHATDGDTSTAKNLQHMLLAAGSPEQTQVIDVFPEDVIDAGSSPDYFTIAEINTSDKRDTLDSEHSDTIPIITHGNTNTHIFNTENIKDNIVVSVNSENIEDITTLQRQHLDTLDSPEPENSSIPPEFNAQKPDNTHKLNLENSQQYCTENIDRTDLLTSECITHTMNTEVADDSQTFKTNHPDFLHTPDTENTAELDTTCPDQQIVDGSDFCVEPISDGVNTQPQEKPSMHGDPSELSSENTPALDSCSLDTRSGSVSVCAEDQDVLTTPVSLPLLLTCAGDQLSDMGGAPGQTCSANHTPAQLEVNQGEGEALTLTQASIEKVTQAQHDGSSPTEGTTRQLMEENNVAVLPEYESLDLDPQGTMEVQSAGPISVAMVSTEPLRAVFQALDQDGDGFVRMEEFLEFAAAYGAEQVCTWVLVQVIVLVGLFTFTWRLTVLSYQLV